MQADAPSMIDSPLCIRGSVHLSEGTGDVKDDSGLASLTSPFTLQWAIGASGKTECSPVSLVTSQKRYSASWAWVACRNGRVAVCLPFEGDIET